MFAVSLKAMAIFRAFLREEERSVGLELGRQMIEQELKKMSTTFAKVQKEKRLQTVAEKMNYRSVDDLLLGVGYGKVTVTRILYNLFPEEREKKQQEQKESLFDRFIERVGVRNRSIIKVDGLDDILVRMGKCCSPIKGDNIVGFVTRGRGVTVHRNNCPKILDFGDDRRVSVQWATEVLSDGLVRIKVVTVDTPGILANISQAISQSGANIRSANVSTSMGKKAFNTFSVELRDTKQLYNMLKAIEKIDGVLAAERT